MNFHALPLEGISHPEVTQIYEDKDGFLWFGTVAGLNRFDGYGYRSYHAEESNQGLPNDHITVISEDSMGRLWVGTQRGAAIYEEMQGRFEPYPSLRK